MNTTHADLAAAVGKARDEAKAVLNLLQSQGHADTTQSSSLYLALVTLQKLLLAADPSPPPIARFLPELEQLAQECGGKLASVKPLIDQAVRLARGQ